MKRKVTAFIIAVMIMSSVLTPAYAADNNDNVVVVLPKVLTENEKNGDGEQPKEQSEENSSETDTGVHEESKNAGNVNEGDSNGTVTENVKDSAAAGDDYGEQKPGEHSEEAKRETEASEEAKKETEASEEAKKETEASEEAKRETEASEEAKRETEEPEEVKEPYLRYTEISCDLTDKFTLTLYNAKAVSYTSGDKTIAKVSASGKVTCKRAGVVDIRVIDENGNEYSCTVRIYDGKRELDVISRKEVPYSVPAEQPVDVINGDFSIEPGTLINFDNRLIYTGTPDGLIKLSESKLTKHLTYSVEDLMLQECVIESLSEMIDDGWKAGNKVFNISDTGAYRTYEIQKDFWDTRISQNPKYGTDPYNNGGVRSVPAVSSEHRTGYALDIQTSDAGYKWLNKNSWKYGWILRYTGDKTSYTGVMDEYWHYTYVGRPVAETCYKEGICLEEYYDKYVYSVASITGESLYSADEDYEDTYKESEASAEKTYEKLDYDKKITDTSSKQVEHVTEEVTLNEERIAEIFLHYFSKIEAILNAKGFVKSE